MIQYDATLSDDWETVYVSARQPGFVALRDWLRENIDNTPIHLLPDKLRFEYTAAGSSWYIDLDGVTPQKQLWKVGFKYAQDAVLFKLIWL